MECDQDAATDPRVLCNTRLETVKNLRVLPTQFHTGLSGIVGYGRRRDSGSTH